MAHSHNELMHSLADHLLAPDVMVWRDMQLGPAGSPRPDVYTLRKSYTRPTPMAYECKVSMSDFRADVTAGKWQTYLPYAAGVYFACELGLLTKADVPDHCGLIVLSGGRWRAAKRPVLRPVSVPQDAWLKLVLDGVTREGPRHRRRGYDEHAHLEQLRIKFGRAAAETVSRRLRVEWDLESAQRQVQTILDGAHRDADDIRAAAKAAAEKSAPWLGELREVLGLSPEAGIREIRHTIQSFTQRADQHPSVERYRRLTLAIQSAIHRHGCEEIVTPAPAGGAE